MITIVSGVPRSGTSMMMQCLVAGGMRALQDSFQVADEFNPRGYYEYGPAMNFRIQDDVSWIELAEGRVVKVMSFGLQFLPVGYDYRVIMMRRPFDACGESMSRKAKRGAPKEFFSKQFEEKFNEASKRLSVATHLPFIEVSYDMTLADPQTQMDVVADFLKVPLDRSAMVAAVAPEIGDL